MTNKIEKTEKTVKTDIARAEFMPSFPSLPSLFRSSLWDDMFASLDDMDNALFEKGGSNTPCDIVEIKKDGVVIATEFSYALAGYEKENVNIEIDEGRLTISVDKSEETKDDNKTYIHRGLTRKRMEWSYIINKNVDADSVTANMENGILKVRVPVVPEKKEEVKKIKVQ